MSELTRRIRGALYEAGRPDVAALVVDSSKLPGRPGLLQSATEEQQRVAHRAFGLVGDGDYCFDCWREWSVDITQHLPNPCPHGRFA